MPVMAMVGLAIISSGVWDRVQEIREGRKLNRVIKEDSNVIYMVAWKVGR